MRRGCRCAFGGFFALGGLAADDFGFGGALLASGGGGDFENFFDGRDDEVFILEDFDAGGELEVFNMEDGV